MTEDAAVAVLSPGEKVHLVFRRLFPGDVRRHFVGEIQAVADDQIRVTGHAFVFDEHSNEYQRKPEQRTRVFSLSTPVNVNVIPTGVDPAQVFYCERAGRLVVTDGGDFTLDVNETA